jgi:SAM-dependent methyltransferase
MISTSKKSSARLPNCIEPAASQFKQKAIAMGLDPEDRWVGGYAAYEFHHLREILKAYGIDVRGKKVLEFGCNVGASAIVLQHMGAQVTAIDISADFVALSRLNALQYGFESAEYLHIPDTRSLPFENDQFDLVVCSSVLESVCIHSLSSIQSELARVTSTYGTIAILGTSSRLWPKEVHSKRWFVNYLPRKVDPILGAPQGFQRGASPFALRTGFGARFENLDIADRGRAFKLARRNFVPPSTPKTLPLFTALANALGIGVGTLLPNFSCMLRKRA